MTKDKKRWIESIYLKVIFKCPEGAKRSHLGILQLIGNFLLKSFDIFC